ncbi:hypothetical protein [Hoeflea sp.]|uniref:hypothetical protein n=1 Tax=Hoeflea sp. TaxID=1940281 RepID=UPI003A92C364
MTIQVDSKEFAGKRVLVSGGTKGLGRATVERFLAERSDRRPAKASVSCRQ